MHAQPLASLIRTNSMFRLVMLTGATLFLTACGSGSGTDVQTNPNTTPPTFSSYSGPSPQTDDVQRFRLNVWDNLVPVNRCGSCHDQDQSPRFVRTDDLNLAYEIANQYVDLSDPGSSRLVTKVLEGHNCWLSSVQACADIVENYVQAWAGESVDTSGRSIQLTAPPLREPGESLAFPEYPPLGFNQLHDLLRTYCADCHTPSSSPAQSPFFAASDIDNAYAAAQPRINLDNPEDSRFVDRLRSGFHNCWSDCDANADDMAAAIAQLASGLDPTPVDPELVTSMALSLNDGIVASIGGRHDNNVIALYEFKAGSGTTAFDTSGVAPALDLQYHGSLSDEERWVGGWGVNIGIDDRWQGSTQNSRKLHDLIRATSEYSVELWVAPANVTQDGPARIASYSGSSANRNFMLGQTLYNYDFLNRSAGTNAAGVPALSTADDDQTLQATLQHVVITYDPSNGRRIFVNGEQTEDLDPADAGHLNDWDPGFALVLGSEAGGGNGWSGQIRLLAIHNRVLTTDQIRENFEVGVGERFYLLFNVSAHVDIQDAYIVFEVSQFDSYSYLFAAPFFVILNADETPANVPLEGMRIGLNGREVTVGQAYTHLDLLLNQADYEAQGQQPLARIGTVIAIDQGPAQDEFFLTFERLGNAYHVRTEPAMISPEPRPDCEPANCPPAIGVRTFDAINATMSAVTGVPTTNSRVATSFTTLRQQLPAVPDMEAFLASHQMGITQLAIEYCSVLVDNEGDIDRATYFPGFDFSAAPAIALDTLGRDIIVDALMLRMIGNPVPSQPEDQQVRTYVNQMFDELSNCSGSGCSTPSTDIMVKAACASVLGSAPVLIQ